MKTGLLTCAISKQAIALQASLPDVHWTLSGSLRPSSPISPLPEYLLVGACRCALHSCGAVAEFHRASRTSSCGSGKKVEQCLGSASQIHRVSFQCTAVTPKQKSVFRWKKPRTQSLGKIKNAGLCSIGMPAFSATRSIPAVVGSAHTGDCNSGIGLAWKIFRVCRAINLAVVFAFLRRALSVEIPVPAYICR